MAQVLAKELSEEDIEEWAGIIADAFVEVMEEPDPGRKRWRFNKEVIRRLARLESVVREGSLGVLVVNSNGLSINKLMMMKNLVNRYRPAIIFISEGRASTWTIEGYETRITEDSWNSALLIRYDYGESVEVSPIEGGFLMTWNTGTRMVARYHRGGKK